MSATPDLPESVTIADLSDELLALFDSPYLPAPFVFKSDDVLSLHFDILSVQSSMRLSAPDELDLDYTRTMMGFLLLTDTPSRVLMIGLGGGSLAKYCHRHFPQMAITVVEIDPQVIELREQFLIPPDDARLQVVCADGAEFLRQTSERWDLVMVDGFTYEGQPEELCSAAFYADCHAALNDTGLMVVNLQAESVALEGRIADAFAGQSLALSSERGANLIVFASRAPQWQPSPSQLLARWKPLAAVHQETLESVRVRLRQELQQDDRL
ncbi:MAG: fused MFS/spermidine synthase [Leptothrix sp. (in: b-proteobacteria)]